MSSQFEDFSWKIIKNIEFSGQHMELIFKSGSKLRATAPTKDILDEFKEEALKQMEIHKFSINFSEATK